MQQWAAYDPKKPHLDPPPRRWHNDAFYAQAEAIRIKATGDTRVRPLAEVEEIDPLWERDVFNELAYLRYLEDYYKLSPEQRAAIEGVKEDIEA